MPPQVKRWFGRAGGTPTEAVADRDPMPLAEHGSLEPPGPGFQLVSASVSADQSLIALWARAGDLAAFTSVTTQPGWATFPDSRTPRDVGAVVCRHDGSQASVLTTIENVPIAHPTVHVLPDERVLLVGTRAHWQPSGPEQNALVFDAHGTLINQATFGDGIEHVQTTKAGDIWVGYFDEGVYGNYGWGSPGPTPIGSSGIVRFDANLELQWEYPSHVDQAWGSVDDCYAMNVVEDQVWACYYSDFPIVRIHSGEVTAWRNDVGGARALVVAGDRVALFGGYGVDRDRLVIGHLDMGQLLVTSTARVVTSDGEPLPQGSIVQGRGESLHVLSGNRWFKLDPLTS